MKKLITKIENQRITTEITQYSFPAFCEGELDENYIKSHFGYLKHIQKGKISLPRLISKDAVVVDHKMLEVPRVITAIDSGFPADEEYNNRLYDIVAMGDNRVWMGVASKELKLFGFQGVLHETVPITAHGLYLAVHNKNVVYTAKGSNTVCRVADDKTIQTMFTSGYHSASRVPRQMIYWSVSLKTTSPKSCDTAIPVPYSRKSSTTHRAGLCTNKQFISLRMSTATSS
jgi:hypothetical protein